MEYTRNFELVLEGRLKEEPTFIQVLLGPRQVGKSTGVKHVFDKWSGPKLMVSADGPSLRNPEWLQIQWQEAQQLGQGTLFVVDEIQKVTSWAETIKELYDPIRSKKQLHIVLLGSASLSIQEGLSAALAGRFELIRVPHWSYDECKSAFDWSFGQFLRFGGYPAPVNLIHDEVRWSSFILNSIIEPVLGRDIAGLVRIAKPALFRQTFELAMSYPSQVISYAKLIGQLQEGGNTSTVRHYLELFESAFLIRLLDRYSGGAVQRKGSSPKIVPLAPALSQAHASPVQRSDPAWQGRVLEALAGAYLSLLPGKLMYWSEGDYEVDFVREFDGVVTAYEVKSARRRKPLSLERFLRRYPKAQSVVLTAEKLENILSQPLKN